jgi:type I restriction enzyme, S subunit
MWDWSTSNPRTCISGNGVFWPRRRFRSPSGSAQGQVLFGKRRAYQRKVAVAEFDGICSSDILTFEPKGDDLLSDLLPFIVQSDGFFDHALGTSSGSLSPRTRWSQLADYEFPLPPKDEQCRLAEVFWATDQAAEGWTQVCEASRLGRNAAHRELFGLGGRSGRAERQSPDWGLRPIGEVCEIANNLRKPINAAERSKIQGSFPYYGPTGVLDHINEFRIEGEYVLIGEDGDHFLKFRDWEMTQFVSGRFNVNNHAHVLRGRDGCRTRWIFHYFKHRDIRPEWH